MYLKQLSDFRKASASKIESSIAKIDSSVKSLKLLKHDKQVLTKEKSQVLDSLRNIKKKFDNLIASNNSQIANLSEQLNINQNRRELVKTEVRKQITNQVDKPISDGKNIVKSSNSKVKSNKLITRKFKSNKRKLLWPLRKFVVLHRFGDYRHRTFNNVVIKNDGIELGAAPRSNVHAVYDGYVTHILNIPGEGISIIIKHGEYYSVYTSVANPEVKVGSYVSMGQVIAYLKSGKKMSKMNFQIWHHKTKLNPISWLKRR